MTLSRRHFIELSTYACLSTGALAACTSASRPTDGVPSRHASTAVTGVSIGFDVFLDQRGYTAAPAASLITSHAFNGGLCYDDDTGAHRQDLREAAGCAC